MKYNVDKKKFLNFLHERPALIKKIVNLNEKIAVECVESNTKCYEYLPQDSQDNVKITKTYVSFLPFLDIGIISTKALKGFSNKERMALIKRNPRILKRLPYVTFDECIQAIRDGGVDMTLFPDYHKTETLFIEVAKKTGPYSNVKIPKKLWEESACPFSFALKLITANGGMLEHIPKKFITKEILTTALNEKNLSLENILIPEIVWDQTLATKAVDANEYNTIYIPFQYITEKMCIQAAKKGVRLEYIPIKTRAVKIMYVISNLGLGYSTIENLIDSGVTEITEHSFQIDVLKELDKVMGLKCLKHLIKNETFLEMLKINPRVIKIMDRKEQTKEMITIFISKATPEIIDECAENINLGKIDKEQVPFLVGCKSNRILGILEKRFKGKSTPTTSKDMLEIDIAPSDFAKIRNKL